MQKEQRLYWALSRALKYLGLTLDEWGFLLGGVVPGIVMVNGEDLLWGIGLIAAGCLLCYAFRKFKKLSEYFLLKSWLLSKGLISAPSKSYPNMLHQRVGK